MDVWQGQWEEPQLLSGSSHAMNLLSGPHCELFLSCETAIDVCDICEALGWPVVALGT